MKKLKMLIFLVICSGISLLSLGCGGYDDDDIAARIVDLFLDDRTIATGESTVLRAQFVFSRERIFVDEDGIILVVRIPAAVSFRAGSAEIQGRFDEDVSPRITDCGEGEEKYLRFRFDDEDLRNASDPSGSADAELALTLDAVTEGTVEINAAAANDDFPFGCGQSFLSDRETAMAIS